MIVAGSSEVDLREGGEGGGTAGGRGPEAGGGRMRALGGPKSHGSVRILIWYIVYGLE